MDADLFGTQVPPSSLVKSTNNFPGKAQAAVERPLSYIHRVYMERLERLYGFDPPVPCRVETVFRHGGWMTNRVRVLQSLERTGQSDKRVARFCGCGGGACVQWSQMAQKHRVKSFTCGDRFCEPCARTRASHVQRNLVEWTKNEKTYFLTFTLKNVETTVSAMLTRLMTALSKVRESVLWRVNVKGGAYMVEIKRGEGSKLWHIHLHAIIVGGCPDQIDLRRLWKDVTRDSHRVDVQESWSREKCCFYAAKYATKGWAQEVVACPADLDECVVALRGRRLLGTFGSWRKRKLEREDRKITDWGMVGGFRTVYAACVAGEAWGVGVFHSLGLDAAEVEGNPVFTLAGGVARASPRLGRRRADPPEPVEEWDKACASGYR